MHKWSISLRIIVGRQTLCDVRTINQLQDNAHIHLGQCVRIQTIVSFLEIYITLVMQSIYELKRLIIILSIIHIILILILIP